MISLIDLEKKINSELGTKINNTLIKHNQIYVEIDKEDLIDVTLFLKTRPCKVRLSCKLFWWLRFIDISLIFQKCYQENNQEKILVAIETSKNINPRHQINFLLQTR